MTAVGQKPGVAGANAGPAPLGSNADNVTGPPRVPSRQQPPWAGKT